MGNLGFRRSLVKDGTRLAKRGIFKSLGLTKELISSDPRPSLNYDFQNGRTLSPNFGYTPVTFSRASGAMQYDLSGYMTFAPENVWTFSEDPTNAAWVKAATTYSVNPVSPPSGISNCGKVMEDAANTLHSYGQTYTYQAGSFYTQSWYLKAAENQYAQLNMTGSAFGASSYANFDLVNGTTTVVGATATAAITSVGSGWYRCSVTALASATGAGTSAIVLINSGSAPRVQVYAGTAGNGLYFSAPQLERSTAVRSYNSTTSSAYYGPRFDYHPTTLASRGLRIEEQRTNLCTYSNDFSNAAWTKTDTTVTSSNNTSPENAANATLLTEGSGGTALVYSAGATITAGATVAGSIFLKRGNHDWIRFQILDLAGSNGFNAWFNLNTGAFGTTASVGTGTYSGNEIMVLPNGWYRISMHGVVSAASTSAILRTNSASADNSTTRVSSSTRYQYGAQIEQTTTPTSTTARMTTYIPTSSASVTRSADISTVTSVTWLNQAEGTVIVTWEQMYLNTNASARSVLVNIDDTTSNNRNVIFANAASGLSQGTTTAGGVTTAGIASGTLAALTTYKSAYVYKQDDFVFYQNGASLGTDVSGAVPSGLTQMRVGHRGQDYLNGWIKSLMYYNRRMTNVGLGQITT